MDNLTLSTLGHTWIIDIDGTVVKHNGYLIDGEDSFLPGAKEFLQSIPGEDMVVFISSRKNEYRELTEAFLRRHGIRYDAMIFNAPYGERILINDDKPSGLTMAHALAVRRDAGISWKICLNDSGL